MLELLSAYTIKDIFIFLIIFLLALKEIINLYDFFKNKNQQLYEKAKEKEEMTEIINKFSANCEQVRKTLDILVASDKDDIKSWLVEKLNYYRNHPEVKIDTYTMDTIEKRYKHYKDEGGNSFIDSVVAELHDKYKGDNNNESI